MADPNITEPPDGDQNRGPTMMAVFITETVVATVVVALRFHSRRLIRNVGWDDWLILATLLLFIATAIVCCYMASIGGCRHLFYLSAATKYHALKLQWIAQPFAIISFATAKASIGVFLLKVLPHTSFYRKWLVWASLVGSVIINVLGALFVFIQCNPPRKLWDSNVEGECWNPDIQSDFEIFVGSWNALIDILLALLPSTILYNLHLPPRQKLGLALILGMGAFAGICAMVKTSDLSALTSRSDLTWETMPLFAWTGSEVFLLIFCGSLPTLKPLYDLVFHGRRFEHYRGSRSRSGYGSAVEEIGMKGTGRSRSGTGRGTGRGAGAGAGGGKGGAAHAHSRSRNASGAVGRSRDASRHVSVVSAGAASRWAAMGHMGVGSGARGADARSFDGESSGKARLVSTAQPVPGRSREGSLGEVPEHGIRVCREVVVSTRGSREEVLGEGERVGDRSWYGVGGD